MSLCGTSRDALIIGCSKEIAVDTGEGKLLWATALALVLLMGKFLDQKDEWEIIAEKGSKWMAALCGIEISSSLLVKTCK